MIPIKIDDENIAFRDLHFLYLNKKLKDRIQNKIKKEKTFKKEVLEWIEERLDDILKGNLLRNIIKEFNIFLKKFNNNSYLKDIVFQKNELKKEGEKILIKICEENALKYKELKIKKGRTKVLKEQYIDLIYTQIKKVDINNDLKYKILKSRINTLLTNIFIDFYEKEWDKIKNYDRYIFVTKHNLKTCPYCNMGYILISERDKKKQNGLRPEIDHFFPKSKYPYLAMSFYNLIPCCQVCNHTKKDKDTYSNKKLLSPYEIDDNTFKLTYRPKDIDFYQIKKQKYNVNNSFEIEFRKIDEHSNEYFKLDKLYAQHKDVVLELLIKRTIYSKSYIAELKKNFHFTDDEIYRFLFCNYRDSEEYSKRPLSKLIKDITDELSFKRITS